MSTSRRHVTFLLSLVLVILLGASVSAQIQQGPTSIRTDVHHDISPPLRELAKHAPPAALERYEVEPIGRLPLPPGLSQLPEDPIRQRTIAPLTVVPGQSFEGLGQGQYGFSVHSVPPDTNGSVGATQYVQWVNTSFAVFSKATGALLLGPISGKTLWQNFGGGCQTNNDGDPIAIYDKLASRWVMSQFSVSTTPYLQCIAISTTPDATGSYYRYSFQYNAFDDYPKMGVWPDAYYETFNMFQNGQYFIGAEACAYDRSAMLQGQTATQICFGPNSSIGGLLPADVDGAQLPPTGAPNYMVYFSTNSLKLYKFHADFQTPANSTFTGPTTINVAAFTPLCNGGTCVPQPSPGVALDSLADRLMYRLAYRNFGSHESLVVNHSVAVSGSGGVRWYEIQNPGGTPVLAQQGTFAPDSTYRWMGSIGMDQAGDIAVGYSKSSSSVYTAIAFAGRTPDDPAGTLETETPVVSGSGSQTTYSRWGDYSGMTIDPVDDCTFWYTQEYIKANGVFNWNTRIVSFSFPNCAPVGLAAYDSSLTAPVCGRIYRSCDSGPRLLAGKDNMSGGAEPNQPNTIHTSCADGTAGTFHVDESIDRLRIATLNGGVLRAGEMVRVTATVWVNSVANDALDVYYAKNAQSPTWTYIATVKPTGTGAQSLSAAFRLGQGQQQAIRANFRKGGSKSSCSSGSYDDHDDLVFAVR